MNRNMDPNIIEDKIWEWIQKYPINKPELTDQEKYCYEMGLRCGALKMAEWKQQQMMEKAVGWLKEHCACPNEFLNTFTEAMYENN